MIFQKIYLAFLSLACLSGCKPTINEENDGKNDGKTISAPNILWITCEDMSPRLGAFGDSLARTPNIDQLAREGVRYTNVYSVSGVCAPSRAALITGLYPTSFGAMHMRTQSRTAAIDQVTDPEALEIPVYEAVPPPEVRCLPEFLRMAGYYCTNNVKTDYQFKSPLSAWDENSDTAHWRNRPDKNTPFFSVFNFTETHESRIWINAGLPLNTDPEKLSLPPYYPETKAVREDLARMYDNIARMDEKVGLLLAQLKEDGLLENTIVFFFSDHGDGTPRAKRWLYDSGIKVPLIIRFPFQERAGSINDRLISFVDFAPTVLSLAGLDLPGYLHGQPFEGIEEAAPRSYVYAAKDRMDPALDRARAVKDKRFKYIRNYEPEKPFVQFIPYRDNMAMMKEMLELNRKGRLDSIQSLWFRSVKPVEELYDTWVDPHEVNNLADRQDFEGVLSRLRGAHENWKNEFGDLGGIPEKDLVKMLWGEEGVQPATQQVQSRIVGDSLYLSCSTPGASIVYKTLRIEQQKPGYWFLYTDPIYTGGVEKVIARANRIGFAHSEPTEIVIGQ